MVIKKKAATIPQLFLERTRHPTNPVGWIENGTLKELTNKEYYTRVRNLTLNLARLGVSHGDRVAILSTTRKEWHLFDMAILAIGAVVVPIYPTYEGEELDYILKQSGSSFIVVENQLQAKKVEKLQNTSLKAVFFIEDNETNQREETYSKLSTSYDDRIENPDDELEKLMSHVQPHDVASIIYTSGTTGTPKGAVVTHEAIMAMLENIYGLLKSQIGDKDKTLVFLPLSHVLGRCDSLTGLRFKVQNIYAESVEKVVSNLVIAKPTIMIAVPRIFEKIYDMIQAKVLKENFFKKAVFDWACASSKNYFSQIESDKAPNASEILQRQLAYKLVFSKIYEQFGGKIRFFVSGGAPLNPEIIKFLQYCNLTILEGYGLTETIAPCCLNPVQKQIPGTVGVPLGDVQVKFDKDGEILIKSKALFSNYYNKPEETDEAFDQEGWFRTGDIGHLTPEGYLKITDRKKDLIITSGGKNVAPQKIESLVQLSPLVANIIVVGDQRKFLSALITLNKESFAPWFEQMGLDRHSSLEELCAHKLTPKLVQEVVDQANKSLQKHEQIKKFTLLPIDLAQHPEFLTPSMKVKRAAITKHYRTTIDTMYHTP